MINWRGYIHTPFIGSSLTLKVLLSSQFFKENSKLSGFHLLSIVGGRSFVCSICSLSLTYKGGGIVIIYTWL